MSSSGESRRTGWLVSVGWALACGLVYLANSREIGSYDTIPTTLLPQAILRGDGLVLDRFAGLIAGPDGQLPDYVEWRGGHLVSRYPVAPALLALPLIVPQRWVWDRTSPGWDAHPVAEWNAAHTMAKNAAAALTALTVLLLHRLLGMVAGPADAAVATLAAGLGSPLWTIASQALWQHGPAALALTAALVALGAPGLGRIAAPLAGACMGLMVAIRLADLVLAAPILLGLALRRPSTLPAVVITGSLILAPALAYNLTTFGTISGGLAALEALHPERHAVPGTWSSDPIGGLLGTLLSPSRGLFVFVPWAALAVGLVPWTWRRIQKNPPLGWAVCGLIPFAVLLSVYSVWWGGFCYGPRYWTEAVPLLAILLAAALDATRSRARPLRLLIDVAIAASVAVQALGAWWYPSSWNLRPANIDTHHERLWDWTDSEWTRMIREKWLR
ncbi:MAG: hypothetical protein KatS3mg108_2341 [Isosphaeraceae bacterium]|nr:MAG: hypothetical protein KatS3mg108_2341 [Isosphaeraceae bacterium]